MDFIKDNLGARVWEEPVVIPTYPAGKPEKGPLFIEKRAYQGSTGKVYPLPVTEKISDEKKDVTYRGIFLENEYLKVMILPELGGRIQRAYDKTNGYDFVYYNHVIRPALVGLTGPWISGGIEFNWPQHHRPSTFAPVDCTYLQNEDCSCTVYLSETDKMYGTKGMAEISLYPGKAYIEIRGQLYNGTDLPQTFLWWANPAVSVNEHTYSVFPPDVNAVMDHGKRAVSTFPIATGEYYKVDYSAGVDISRYQNVPVPTSYMVAHSDYDFIGNYDESKQAGLLHVADHHVAPGKKQWTWGNGDFGRMWDRNLTETDGPYIELMTGVFTDNQPDFTWLKPQEEKCFVQYFMPYKGVGRIGNATKEAVISLFGAAGPKDSETANGKNRQMTVKVYATAEYSGAELIIDCCGIRVQQYVLDLTPERCEEISFPAEGEDTEYCARLCWKGRTLVEYKVYEEHLEPVPSPADALKRPEEIASLEELYLAATHLEQYRHATREPADYYREGLKRDATDIRLNDGYGVLLLRRGRAAESIPFFRAAIHKQTWKNPNPYHGECMFHLGLALMQTGQEDAAYDAFYKSTWSAETQGVGFYWLAAIAARRKDYETALSFAEMSLLRGWHNMKGRTLKAALLRKLGRPVDIFLTESLAIDPLYMGCLYEKMKSPENAYSLEQWQSQMRNDAHNYLTLALDYMEAGFYEEAIEIVKASPEQTPMCLYDQGYAWEQKGDVTRAKNCYAQAELADSTYCFPSKTQEIRILEAAIRSLGRAPMAHYYLGNLLYDKKSYEEAVQHWEMSVQENGKNSAAAMTYRNLSIAYYNKRGNVDGALEAIGTACRLDHLYARFWLEQDQLFTRAGYPLTKRLAVLEKIGDLKKERDDLYLRWITLLNGTGRFEEALQSMIKRQFHPWEGGEGKVSAQYRFSLVHLAIKKLEQKDPEAAIDLLEKALNYPTFLGEGKLPNVPDNREYYYMGLAYRMKGCEKEAVRCLNLAAAGDQEPAPVLYYNDQPSDYIFYQGLAQRALGEEAKAKKAFHRLLSYGERHLFDKVDYDFFAVSLPEIEVYQENITARNVRYCNYLRALGTLGLGDENRAEELLRKILADHPEDQGAREHLWLITGTERQVEYD